MQPIIQQVLAEIRDADFKPGYTSPLMQTDYDVRQSARGVLFWEGKLAILHVKKWNYHKLPGGGIEDGENAETGFVREVKEETGCDCKILEPKNSPVIVEYRDEFKLLQISHLMAAEVVGKPEAVAFTQEEIEEGFELLWVPVSEVVALLSADKPTNYEGQFIKKRDLLIVNHLLTAAHLVS